MFKQNLESFINSVIKAANKHKLVISETKLKSLNNNYECYHYVHSLALQNPIFLETKFKLNNKGKVFKRQLLTPLVTLENPCYKPQNYVKFQKFTPIEKGQYLAGLIEANGCFCANGNSKSLKISFDPKDRFIFVNIILTLTDNLNQFEAAKIGFRFNDSSKYNQAELVITKEALTQVLKLIHNHLIGTAKINQIKQLNLDKEVGLIFTPLPSIPISSLWLSGFMDGDGAIYYSNKEKKWIISFGQNAKVNPLIIQKLCNLIPSISGTVTFQNENVQKVVYSHPTIVITWLEIFQQQKLQTHKFHKLEQLKVHWGIFIKENIQAAHLNSSQWDEWFKSLSNRQLLNLITDDFYLVVEQWKFSYQFKTGVWTDEKVKLALELEPVLSKAKIAERIGISPSHVKRFFQDVKKGKFPNKKKQIHFKLQPRPQMFYRFTLNQMKQIDSLIKEGKTNSEIAEIMNCDRRIIGSYKNNSDWAKELAHSFETEFPDNKTDVLLKKKFLRNRNKSKQNENN